jgi:hypothetical protein
MCVFECTVLEYLTRDVYIFAEVRDLYLQSLISRGTECQCLPLLCASVKPLLCTITHLSSLHLGLSFPILVGCKPEQNMIIML